ncbi:hypothetical protein RchiOBHm_Chr1g0361271 [Rosa chinensis]|uniref:Uncharacterized protein n=1 Tax=Rosa chinensis TaxID=74649 RepID=A0A2P6SIW9_ROSCH|nr:hypothetical protein RchiOBHm_Chr1g0361271 [Rosa chinensis]
MFGASGIKYRTCKTFNTSKAPQSVKRENGRRTKAVQVGRLLIRLGVIGFRETVREKKTQQENQSKSAGFFLSETSRVSESKHRSTNPPPPSLPVLLIATHNFLNVRF